MNRHVPIDLYWLAGRYVSDEVSASAIAEQLGCSEQTVRRRLRAYGIRVRPRGPRPRRVALIQWSAELAWVVGLLATDGNLGRERASLSLVSRDVDVLETVGRCLRLATPIRRHGRTCHRLQWRDRRLYDWLVGVGLTPAKSLTLAPLTVPDEYFRDFLRGCIDGDGSVFVYVDHYNAKKNDRYVYERLYVSVVSASRPFIDWLRATTARLLGVSGSIRNSARGRPHPLWVLRYAKSESLRVLAWIYHSHDVPCMVRKRVSADKFLAPLGRGARGPGRPRAGWLYTHESNV